MASLLEEVFCGDHTAHSLRKNRAPSQAGGRFGVLSAPQLVQRLDVKEEVIETILSYIEVPPPASLSMDRRKKHESPLIVRLS